MEWSQVINNPFLRDLPFKIELNKWGKIFMTLCCRPKLHERSVVYPRFDHV
jgi:hypothetical protein